MIQRILKPKDKVVIMVDFRERNSQVADYLRDFGALVKFLPLEVGDYLCSERVCIERKSGNDFVSSIIDGRLMEQAKDLKLNFQKPLILIEGSYRESINENAIKSAIASLLVDFEIPVLMTRDERETARTIFWIAKREQREGRREVGIKGKKKPKETRELQEHIISGLPGISTVLSRRIMKKFKTIRRFACASEDEISKVKGIGKVLAKKLYKLLNEEYGGSE